MALAGRRMGGQHDPNSKAPAVPSIRSVDLYPNTGARAPNGGFASGASTVPEEQDGHATPEDWRQWAERITRDRDEDLIVVCRADWAGLIHHLSVALHHRGVDAVVGGQQLGSRLGQDSFNAVPIRVASSRQALSTASAQDRIGGGTVGALPRHISDRVLLEFHAVAGAPSDEEQTEQRCGSHSRIVSRPPDWTGRFDRRPTRSWEPGTFSR